MPEGSAPTAETLLPAATTHATQALRSSNGVSSDLFLPEAGDVLEIFDQISQTVMPQLYSVKQAEAMSSQEASSTVPFHEIVDKYEDALSRIMATLAKVPQNLFDQKMQTLANNLGNVHQLVNSWEQCDDKQQQMAMQNQYLDALEKSVALQQLKVVVVAEGGILTMFDNEYMVSDHLKPAQDCLKSYRTQVKQEKSDLVQHLQEVGAMLTTTCGEARITNFSVPAPTVDDGLEELHRVNIQPAPSPRKSNAAVMRVLAMWRMQDMMEIVLEKTKMHVIAALPTEEKKIDRLISPLAEWASSVQKTYDTLTECIDRARQYLELAKEDLEDRQEALQNRKQKMMQLETVALELGSASAMGREEEDVKQVEENCTHLEEKLQALLRRQEALAPQVKPLLRHVGHQLVGGPSKAETGLIQREDDQIPLEEFSKILEELQARSENANE
jgi:hypothetical protein